MACPHVESCALYPHFKLQSLLQVWKINYCEGDFSRCERFKLSCSGDKVPLNLLPNGKLLDIKLPPTK